MHKHFMFISYLQILPSQRQSKTAKMYDVWVAINIEHGWILTGNCSCMAGLGSVCSHVAALLFKLESAAHYKLNSEVACTSKLCSWKATKKHVHPAPIKNINFRRAKKHSLPSITKSYATGGNFSVMDPSEGPNKITIAQFQALYSKNKTAAVFTSISEKDMHDSAPRETGGDPCNDSDTDSDTEDGDNFLPEPLTSLFDPTAVNLTPDELASFSLKQFQYYEDSYPQKAYDNLCDITKTQSLSSSWMLHRAGRITASTCYEISKTKVDKPSKSLLDKIMQYESCSTSDNKYTRYGKKHESAARESYKKIISNTHADVKVLETGFHVRAIMPFLGASPDGLVSCSCHPHRVLEIKCPFKYQHGFKSWENDKDFPVTRENQMKKNHKYYFQIQLQMVICNATHGDFFMYTPNNSEDYILIEVEVDETLVNFLVTDLWSRFKKIILPEIVSRKSDEIENIRKLYCKCRRPAFGQMIACDSANCKIEWYHYPCVNVTRAPKRSWFCENCRKK